MWLGVAAVCRSLSVLFGFVSAYYWYRASTAKVTGPSRHHPGVEFRYDDPDEGGQQIHVVASSMEQSRLNKVAAGYTALAIACQALATALSEWMPL
jgi:hypothetical protein